MKVSPTFPNRRARRPSPGKSGVVRRRRRHRRSAAEEGEQKPSPEGGQAEDAPAGRGRTVQTEADLPPSESVRRPDAAVRRRAEAGAAPLTPRKW